MKERSLVNHNKLKSALSETAARTDAGSGQSSNPVKMI